MVKDALVSECGKYRYWLSRTWDATLPVQPFVMLNPSKADATEDDPTIRRCVGYAKAWDCGGIWVVNLFAIRATDPADAKKAPEPVGPDNDEHLRAVLAFPRPIVVAWGRNKIWPAQVWHVCKLLQSSGRGLWCLGINQDGSPTHPLMLRTDAELKEYYPRGL